MLTNFAFVFNCVRASSALVRTSAFLQPVVRGQVYSFEISPPLLPKPSRYTHPFCIRFFTFSSFLMLLVEYCHVYCILWLKCYFVVILYVNINNNFCLVFLSLKILYPYWSRLGSSTEMGKHTFLIMFVIHVLS